MTGHWNIQIGDDNSNGGLSQAGLVMALETNQVSNSYTPTIKDKSGEGCHGLFIDDGWKDEEVLKDPVL